MISACLITYNEEELLPQCLAFLQDMSLIKEICIIDSDSTDATQNIIRNFSNVTDKTVKFKSEKFNNFRDHRNLSLEMATEDWILIIDADETYTKTLAELAQHIKERGSYINAVRIPTLIMVSTKFYLNKSDVDPHVRMFRRGYAKFQREVHELLTDCSGRILHSAYDPDILTTMGKYPNVWLKHWQITKNDSALIKKGERWETLGMIAASKEAGIPISKDFWINVKKNEPQQLGTLLLPEEWE